MRSAGSHARELCFIYPRVDHQPAKRKALTICEGGATEMAISDMIAPSSGFRALIRHRTRRTDRFSGTASRRNGHGDSGTLSFDARRHGWVPCTDFDRRRKTMSSSHSALATSTGRGSDGVPTSLGHTQTKVAAQDARRLTAQTKSILESNIRL